MQVSFSGSPGQYASMVVTQNTVVVSSGALVCTGPSTRIREIDILVLRPNGTPLQQDNNVFSPCATQSPDYQGTKVINLGPLPDFGEYRVIVQQKTATGTGMLGFTLSPAVEGALAANGATTNVNVTRPGQGMTVNFSGTSGEFLSLLISQNTTAVVGGGLVCTGGSTRIPRIAFRLLKPDGTQLLADTHVFTTCSTSSPEYQGKRLLNLGPIPSTGDYKLVVQQPSAAGTGTLGFTLSSPVNGGVLAINGAKTAVTASRPGQSFEATFSGTFGQLLASVVNENNYNGTSPFSCTDPTAFVNNATIRILNPDGSQLASGTFNGALCSSMGQNYYGRTSTNLPALPSTGTYRILVQQNTAGTGTMGIAVLTR
jgi:hypothetical protein